MKKFLLSIVGTALAALLITGASYAQTSGGTSGDTKGGAETSKTHKAAKEKVTGTIKSVDAEKDELVVTPEGGGTDMTFKVKKSQAKKLKTGEEVHVTYKKSGTEDIATRITKAKKKAGTTGGSTTGGETPGTEK